MRPRFAAWPTTLIASANACFSVGLVATGDDSPDIDAPRSPTARFSYHRPQPRVTSHPPGFVHSAAMDPGRRPPNRLDAEGRREVAPTWESLVDRQIRAKRWSRAPSTTCRSRVSACRSRTRPSPATARWRSTCSGTPASRRPGSRPTRRSGRCSTGARRSSLGSDRRRCRCSRPRLARRRDRAELEQLVVAINAAVARLNAEAPTDRQHRSPLVLADELARFDALVR